MKLIDLRLDEYLDILLSDAPAPGGGSVSALAGAQGAALIAMVADLTTSKEKYADDHETCRQAHSKAGELYASFAEAIDKDTEAFNLVSAAFKMPKGTDEEKAARRKAIDDGTLEATKVPFGVMKMAEEALRTAGSMVGHSNPNCSSDLGVGILNLMCCIRGAWLNVKINLPGVKDEAFATECEKEGKRIIEECEALADSLYRQIEESL